MVKLKCYHCQSENLVRNGKTNNDKQRYLCNNCGKMSRDNPQPNGYLPAEREQILAAYQERSSLRGINLAKFILKKMRSKLPSNILKLPFKLMRIKTLSITN